MYKQYYQQKDKRFLIIVGPCSVHDPIAAFDYATRLSKLQKKYKDYFYIVMRTYFEKPRTLLGWRGLIVEPALDGLINIGEGLEQARKLLKKIAELELATATEMLDPLVPQYISDLVSWASIGARSAESQIHRELASALSMPVGFKNTTYGDEAAAINGIVSSRQPHAFMSISRKGLSAIIHTTGNPDSHLILRGGLNRPNYDRKSILKAERLLKKAELIPSILVDCSHGNSQKQVSKQAKIFLNLIEQRFNKKSPLESLRGCMMESFIQKGNCSITECKKPSEYGKSITDPCMSWQMTEKAIDSAYNLMKSLLK